MKVVVVTPEYPDFVRWMHKQHPGIQEASYEEQLAVRHQTAFLWSDFYSRNLRDLGHESDEIYLGNFAMQTAWARENDVRWYDWEWAKSRYGIPRPHRQWTSKTTQRILLEQVKRSQPDVLLLRDINPYSTEFIRALREHTTYLVGQHASGLREEQCYDGFDLLLSSIPDYVNRFRFAGANAELFRLGFESGILERLGSCVDTSTSDICFVGKIGADHQNRVEVLEGLADRVPLALWGSLGDEIPATSVLRRCFRGMAWGIDMYRILAGANVVINHHEVWAGTAANNMRLFEATGVGACLLTDHRDNLQEMFEVGSEVMAYHSVEECAEMAVELLTSVTKRKAVAKAGQARTLRTHTYRHRMEDLYLLIEQYMRHAHARTPPRIQ